MYKKYAPTTMQISSFMHRIVAMSIGFVVTIGFYFCTRLYFYPLKAHGSGIKVILNPIDFFINLKYRFFDMVTFAADLANLSWMPKGHQLIKGLLIIIFAGLMGWLIYKNKKQPLIWFYLGSMVLFMWPAVLRYYSSRYLYAALPFAALLVITLITDYQASSETTGHTFQKWSLRIVALVTIFNIGLFYPHMRYREHILHENSLAFDALAQNQTIHNRPLCFMALPYEYFVTGVAQALYMRGIPEIQPIYYDISTFVWNNKPVTNNDITIALIKNGFRFTSHNDAVFFSPYSQFTNMGTTIQHRQNHKTGACYDISYTIDQQWLTPKPLFIRWDFDKHLFIIMESL